MLQKKKHALRAFLRKLFEFEDQGKFYLICLLENMQVIFCSFWRAVLNEK